MACRGDREPRVACVAHEEAGPVDARDPARVPGEPLEHDAAVAGLGEAARRNARTAGPETALPLSSISCHQPHDRRFPREQMRKLERLSSRPEVDPFPDKRPSPPARSLAASFGSPLRPRTPCSACTGLEGESDPK